MTNGIRTRVALVPALAILAVGVAVTWRLLFAAGDSTTSSPPISFSIKDAGYSAGIGFHPADILVPGPAVAIPCASLGLVCTDPATGLRDDMDGLSYGTDFTLRPEGAATQFSVAAGSMGVAGTAVAAEAACQPPEPQADVFGSNLDGGNGQQWDGNGAPCAGNAGAPLGLCEGGCPGTATPDDIDGIAPDPSVVDPAGTRIPSSPVYLTLAPGSPSLSDPSIAATDPGGSVTPADILTTVGGLTPRVWADGATNLGLKEQGDVIDAICVSDNGDGIYGAGDRLLFSLKAGSPTLALLGASAADLLAPGPVVAIPAARLGLRSTDDLDALSCPNNTTDLSITKTASVNPPSLVVTYAVTVTNKGPDTATGVVITDTLPANVAFNSAAPATCTQAFGIVNCPIGTLAPLASATATVTVTGTAPGAATDRAVVSGNEYDLNPANNAAMVTTMFCRRSSAAGGALVYTPWTDPTGDDDCDGFSTSVENFAGTNPDLACGMNAWAPDFNSDMRVNLTDVVLLKPHFGAKPPSPNYSPRFDLNADSQVNLTDVVVLKPFFGLMCSP